MAFSKSAHDVDLSRWFSIALHPFQLEYGANMLDGLAYGLGLRIFNSRTMSMQWIQVGYVGELNFESYDQLPQSTVPFWCSL